MPDSVRIYMIRCMTTGYIKIGVSKDCGRRLKQHQCGSPTQLCLEKTWPVAAGDASHMEARLHRLCRGWHVHGEWFQPEAAQTVKSVMADEGGMLRWEQY